MLKYILIFFLTLPTLAQNGFQPQDADEAEAWKIYNEYRNNRVQEETLERSIKQNFTDALMGAHGGYSIHGVDRDAAAAVPRLRAEVDALRQRQRELISAWDLRWAMETLQDPKTGRQMDRIEFGLIYFRFARQQASSPPFRGVWRGAYSNTRNEPGEMVLELEETGGKVTGYDDGLPILNGKRVGQTMTWVLMRDGGFEGGGCTWNVTVEILDGGQTLAHRYTGHDHRSDKDNGHYSGGATLRRQ